MKAHAWLRQKGWESAKKATEGNVKSASQPVKVWITKGSAEWERWTNYNGKPFPSIRSAEHGEEGWYAPTKLPPISLPPATVRYVDKAACHG
ncbi:hypothetical protein GJ654_04320 [Rhodoblastus acidophilus]|uniref:Uncharacterized protein n=1 Tax=Rhodoblastus acidophilus TaxID=1074 RepID=A0A6N8DN66_RHOAC|nr:hypothetical protein [Rhodoblastus acidophilus]MCW2273323.1 hypothetical protein [Rhodoblastus acidophilus]MTV30214.1 hypothetical protein [Rhodoblastus acidophilus]